MNHLGSEECPLCWRFDCKCWEAQALAAAARKSGDGTAPSEGPQSGDAKQRNAQTQ